MGVWLLTGAAIGITVVYLAADRTRRRGSVLPALLGLLRGHLLGRLLNRHLLSRLFGCFGAGRRGTVGTARLFTKDTIPILGKLGAGAGTNNRARHRFQNSSSVVILDTCVTWTIIL